MKRLEQAGSNSEISFEGGLRTRGFYKTSTPEKPLVSVITVVLNRHKHIERAIKSVINQTYDNIEYIIIDGKSTDGTLDVIKRFGEYIDYWISEPDKGMYYALNKGIVLSNGSLIGIVHSDDIYLKNDIVRQIVEADKIFKGDIYHGNMLSITEYEQYCAFKRVIPDSSGILKTHASIIHPTCFIKREVFNNIGFYDTSYKSASDYEFFIRCAKNSCKFIYLNIDITAMSSNREGRVSSMCYSHIEAYKFHKKHKTGYHCKYLTSYINCCIRRIIRRFILSRFGIRRDIY